jgi:hypothetical protein
MYYSSHMGQGSREQPKVHKALSGKLTYQSTAYVGLTSVFQNG